MPVKLPIDVAFFLGEWSFNTCIEQTDNFTKPSEVDVHLLQLLFLCPESMFRPIAAVSYGN